MGAASYRRGSAAIRAGIDREQTPAELLLLRDLTAFSARQKGTTPFAETVIRFGPQAGEVSLMSRQRAGWGAYSYSYPSVWRLAREWRLAFVGFGQDEHGRFLRVVPAAER